MPSSCLMTLQGFPTATQPAGMERVTTLPAPMVLPMKGSPAMHFSYSVIIAENVFPYKNTNQFSKMQDFILFIFDKLFLKAEYGMWSGCKNWNIS